MPSPHICCPSPISFANPFEFLVFESLALRAPCIFPAIPASQQDVGSRPAPSSSNPPSARVPGKFKAINVRTSPNHNAPWRRKPPATPRQLQQRKNLQESPAIPCGAACFMRLLLGHKVVVGAGNTAEVGFQAKGSCCDCHRSARRICRLLPAHYSHDQTIALSKRFSLASKSCSR